MEHIYAVHEQLVLNSRWLFDVEQDRLVDLQGRVPSATLAPVTTRVLSLLAHAPQALLRRRDLLDKGWRSFGFEVCENSLNQVICSLRNTFETLEPGRPYIKTVPRIGYCLLAEVRPATPEDRPGQPSRHCLGAESGLLPNGAANDKTGLAAGMSGEMTDDEWRRAQRSGLPLALLMIGVDHSRDSCGHKAGDEARIIIARCIGEHIHRAGDSVMRYNDGTFAVLLPDTGREGATRVAEKIRMSVQAFDWRDRTGAGPAMTVSTGVACTAPAGFGTFRAFVNAADGALREATDSGGNRVICDAVARPDIAIREAAEAAL